MTKKKKQRKGRKAKNESKQEDQSVVSNEESERQYDREDCLKDMVAANIEIQKDNKILEPLYSLMTTLQIISCDTNGKTKDILQEINIQDYDFEADAGGYEYKLALRMHRKVRSTLRVL